MSRRSPFGWRRLWRVGRAAARTARVAHSERGLGAPRAELRGLTPVEHAALPVAGWVQDVNDDRWRERGEWVLDPGHRRGPLRHSCHPTPEEALDAALMLPKARRTSDVVIRFRREEGPGVAPFATDERVPPLERLAVLEREERTKLAREASARQKVGA